MGYPLRRLVMRGLRSPGYVWGWGTSNCQSLGQALAVPDKRDFVTATGIKMDKILKTNVLGYLGLYTPSKGRGDKTALWVQG